MLVEEHGVPLSIVVTGANRHDVTQLETLLDNIVIKRPEPAADQLQQLCADRGYDGKPAYQSILDRDYIPQKSWIYLRISTKCSHNDCCYEKFLRWHRLSRLCGSAWRAGTPAPLTFSCFMGGPQAQARLLL